MLNALAASALAVAFQISPPGAPQVAGANDPDLATDSLTFRGRMRELDVLIPRIERPDVKLDGHLDDEAWSGAALLTDFTQYEPVEGIASTEPTEVYVFYSSDAIYFGIRAADREPDLILARMGERDRVVFNDDWVRILLDTFDDQRQAYVFYVNPLGLQTDGLWIEGLRRGRGGYGGSGVSIDYNPDFIWESNGRVTDDGWTAELKIPYVSLRFREAPVQSWGVNISREVKRKGFKQSWAPLTQNVSSTLAQSGRFVGLRDLKPRRLVEVNPVATGKRTGQEVDGQFSRNGFDPELGVNARYGLTQNLILDATVNPDFSQVEADVNRITVNERFALFFPEKRPFFLEGTEIFRTPRNLVHTRQIIDPTGGAKVTGKVGSFNVGYLGALDESPKTLDDKDDPALFNLFRIRRDVGAGSTIGLLYTDRTVTGGGEYNRVLASDARLLLGGRYTLTTQFAGSWTAEDGAGTALRPLVMADLARSGQNFGFQVKFDDVHPEFQTQTGFIPRVGDTELFGSIRMTNFGAPGSILERFNVRLMADAFFDHNEFWSGGTPFEAEVELVPTFSFKGDRSVTLIVRDGFFRFRPEVYSDYEVTAEDGQLNLFTVPGELTHMKALALVPRVRVTNQIQLSGRLYYREIPLFMEAARGLELQIAPDVTVQPTAALQLQLSHTYSQMWRQRDDSEFSTVNLSRVRTQYQFGKALFVRAIVQYELEERDALRDPTTELPLVIDGEPADRIEEGSFQGQFLLSYEPSPGTIFFIGYSRMEEGEKSYRLSRMRPVEDGLFVKLSYLFRM
jgi:hypothetical protein